MDVHEPRSDHLTSSVDHACTLSRGDTEPHNQTIANPETAGSSWRSRAVNDPGIDDDQVEAFRLRPQHGRESHEQSEDETAGHAV
jgi:hypothetical protein